MRCNINNKHISNAARVQKVLVAALFALAMPLWSQHAAHTHGVAELNLILNTEREIVAELITPADSVYGFEHAPRTTAEKAQMEKGLKRLKASLAKMLVIENQNNCSVSEMGGDEGVAQNSSQNMQGATQPAKQAEKHHTHHHKGHGESSAGHHKNVALRWKIQCGSTLSGQRVIVNWSEALPDVHKIKLTLLTPDQQSAISLKRSGTKIRL